MASDRKKLTGYTFWKETLGEAKYVVAPMVDQSELAWRMLSRKYGADLCYTPMFHSSVFTRDTQYRNDALASCSGDRPLIIQFCGNDPQTMLEASLLAQDHCDAIDINLGCPQAIAKRGQYGAYLAEDQVTVEKIVKKLADNLSVPVTCKIRVFPDLKKSIQYAQMLEKAGCQLLTVHGRTKEMRGPKTGLANWKYIKAIKEAVSIPVFANGNIQYKEDVDRCILETGVDGVMIAEGSLHNPALFTGEQLTVWDSALEYLDFAEKYSPCPISYARGHVFKICHHAFQLHTDARQLQAAAKTIPEMREAVKALKRICTSTCRGETPQGEKLPLPHWICQPYVRPPPVKDTQVEKSRPNVEKSSKKGDDVPQVAGMSKKRMKKLLKRKNVPDMSHLSDEEKAVKLAKFLEEVVAARPVYSMCLRCSGNPCGQNCVYFMCKTCCKDRVKELGKPCPRHNGHKAAKMLQNSKKPPTNNGDNSGNSFADSISAEANNKLNSSLQTVETAS